MFRRRMLVSWRSVRCDISVPSRKTLPELKVSSPAMQCMSVDLPDPLGPIMVENSPDANSTVTPSRARTVSLLAPYTLLASTALAAGFVVVISLVPVLLSVPLKGCFAVGGAFKTLSP